VLMVRGDTTTEVGKWRTRGLNLEVKKDLETSSDRHMSATCSILSKKSHTRCKDI
jgi:hypothetical protein